MDGMNGMNGMDGIVDDPKTDAEKLADALAAEATAQKAYDALAAQADADPTELGTADQALQRATAAVAVAEMLEGNQKALARAVQLVENGLSPMGDIAVLDGTTRSFTVNAGEVADNDDEDTTGEFMAGKAPAVIDDGSVWTGTRSMRTTADADTDMDGDQPKMEMVVSYTNQAAAEADEYSDYYSLSNADDITGIQSIADLGTGNVITFADDGNVSDISMRFYGSALPMGANNFVIFEDDEMTDDVNERMFEGMFHGVPGTFACTDDTECRAENDGDGNLAKLLGAWTFTPAEQEADDPAYMVAGVVDDEEYLDFGYWIVEGPGEGFTIGTYATGTQDGGTNTAGYGSIAALTGKAEYEGPATGLYMKKRAVGGGAPTSATSGQFTAHAKLTAIFGGPAISVNDEDSISGTVSTFMDAYGNLIDRNWTVTLNKIGGGEDGGGDGTFTDGTFVKGTTSTGEGSTEGEWSGRFEGPADDSDAENGAEMPTAVTGIFDAHFDNGHLAGGFAAPVEEEDM